MFPSPPSLISNTYKFYPFYFPQVYLLPFLSFMHQMPKIVEVNIKIYVCCALFCAALALPPSLPHTRES